ncbi:MAG: HAD-IA family hydrolase [Bryobacterales bacterium]|nr:HAD-IA family hydrolase [Bryobacterales bacterium]
MAIVEAFIFDLDGVIIHSTPLHNRAWEIYLERHSISPDRVQGRMHGLRNDDIVRDFFGEGLTPEAIHQHGADKEVIYRELMKPELETWIVPGVREFLKRHAAVPMAVASNAEPLNIEFVLTEAGLGGRFLHVVDGHDVVHPKPAPDIYLKAAGLLGVDPTRCVIFEDSIPGVQAGVAAGARVAGIQTTLAAIDGAEIMIKDFCDPALEEWLRLTGA